MSYLAMADAAYAQDIPPGFQIAAGYYGGQWAAHVWDLADWERFPGCRLPIWVPADPGNGPADAGAAVAALHDLGVPPGSLTVLDMELRQDIEYVTNFGAVLAQAGYKTWLYGSLDFVFANPPLNGYWVAHYTGQPHMVDHPKVRATQWAANLVPGYDASDVLRWTAREMWHG